MYLSTNFPGVEMARKMKLDTGGSRHSLKTQTPNDYIGFTEGSMTAPAVYFFVLAEEWLTSSSHKGMSDL
jgi:hypothetical protein